MRIPFAADHNIPPGPNDPRIIPRIIVIHTMAGFIEGAEARFKSTGLEAHFGFALDGRLWQWRDTDWQADAQGEGNGYCISLEFEDAGDCMRPFSSSQVANFDRVCRVLMAHYNIPARLVRATSERGFGYHRQFHSWNPNNHACPCDTRQDALIRDLIPALALPGEEDMTREELLQVVRGDDFRNAVELAVKLALQRNTTSGHVFVKSVDAPDVYVVTPLGLISVDDPTHFSRMSGGKPIGETTLIVSQEWVDLHNANAG